MAWVEAVSLDALKACGQVIRKFGRKQILMLATPRGVYACNNRCPHEGYPLAEGTLSQGCLLTCNWHNWKFDLSSGETLVGGDQLRLYPVRVENGAVFVDLADPPAAERRAAALANLRQAYDEHDYARIAREVARYAQAEGDPVDLVAEAVSWSHDRFEFGMGHAYAAAPDWLALGDIYARDAADRLAAIVEIIGHMAEDTLRAPAYPFPENAMDYDEDTFAAAIEREDETEAVGRLAGGLAAGLGFADFAPALARAALSHYQGFGHSAIYVAKAGELAARLGERALRPLLLALVRHLVYARREDLLPEFRCYGEARASWDGTGGASRAPGDFAGLGPARSLDRALEGSSDMEGLYQALLGAAGWNMLHYDLSCQERTDNPVSDNVGWLDFTHAITFANAARALCERVPALWPDALLQMALFAGRNAGHIDRSLDWTDHKVEDGEAFLARAMAGLFDHAVSGYIFSCHYVKLLTAIRAEIRRMPEGPAAPLLLAAANRFLNAPLKAKHVRRTAAQALDFVAIEG